MGGNGRLNGRVDRALAAAAALATAAAGDPIRDAYDAELRRRQWAALVRLDALIPADLAADVCDHARAALKAHGLWDCGGVWDWHRSLLWCHSTLPDGLGEAAVRENVRRFLRFDRTLMTRTCWDCGLATTMPGVGRPDFWSGRDQPPEPCPHCGGVDLVASCSMYSRPAPSWKDDWTLRYRPSRDQEEAVREEVRRLRAADPQFQKYLDQLGVPDLRPPDRGDGDEDGDKDDVDDVDEIG
jgi:hypothetical protein